MTYGIRTGSILGENIAAHESTKSMNRWIAKAKMLCWKCQKDVPRNMGTISFMIKNETGHRITHMNAPKKFICFACKPKEKTA